jgi:hypothetical protein
MPKIPSHAKDATSDPTVEPASGLLVSAGISLMRCTRMRGYMRIRCPRCRASQDIFVARGATVEGMFKYRRKTCLIARRSAEAFSEWRSFQAPGSTRPW